MSAPRSPGGPVQASRARRATRRRWSRGGIAAAIALVLAGGVWLASRPSGGSPEPSASSAESSDAATGAARLLSLSITGGSAPYLAVIGAATGSLPAATMPIPPELTIVVPGQGETTAADVAALPGPSVQVALSNEMGAWTQDVAVMNLDGFARLVDRSGGLSVDLAAAVVTDAGVLGPGQTQITGTQAAALLSAKGGDPTLRWTEVLRALLADPPTLQPADLLDVSSLASVQRTLDAAAKPTIVSMPTQTLAATVEVSQQPALDDLVGRTWGTPRPTPVIVQNGNGAPGVGEAVARAIIPAGFRVTLSQNAESFDVPTTDVIANGTGHVEAARRARQALGVGRVQASRVPSGVGDVTIVVGKDFTA